MNNVRHEDGVWVFRVLWTGFEARILPGLPFVVSAIGALAVFLGCAWYGDQVSAFSPDRQANIALIMLLVPFGLVVVGAFISTHLALSGRWARYEIRIDLDAQKVAAVDRKRKRSLWENPYDPDKLYISKNRVHTRYSSYLRPVLVYGDSRQDLVEFGKPTERKTVLTVGSMTYLSDLMKHLQMPRSEGNDAWGKKSVPTAT